MPENIRLSQPLAEGEGESWPLKCPLSFAVKSWLRVKQSGDGGEQWEQETEDEVGKTSVRMGWTLEQCLYPEELSVSLPRMQTDIPTVFDSIMSFRKPAYLCLPLHPQWLPLPHSLCQPVYNSITLHLKAELSRALYRSCQEELPDSLLPLSTNHLLPPATHQNICMLSISLPVSVWSSQTVYVIDLLMLYCHVLYIDEWRELFL